MLLPLSNRGLGLAILGGGRGGFTPLSFPGLQLWLDAADTPTGSVATWVDKSGNGNNATQGTAANRPVNTASAINDKNGIIYDSNDALSIASNASIDNIFVGGATVFMVVDSIAGNGRYLDKSDSGAGGIIYGITSNGSGTYAAFFEQQTSATTAAFATDDVISSASPAIVCLDYNSNNLTTAPNFAVNGAGVVMNTTVSGTGTPDDDATRPLIVGNRSDLARSILGDVGEVIVYDRILTAAEKVVVNSYLSTKWGITLS